MNGTKTGHDLHQRLLSVATAARYLGVSKKTIYYWIKTRQVPFLRIGRLVFFDRRDIETWLSQCRVGSSPGSLNQQAPPAT